jgi:hypothetical protein
LDVEVEGAHLMGWWRGRAIRGVLAGAVLAGSAAVLVGSHGSAALAEEPGELQWSEVGQYRGTAGRPQSPVNVWACKEYGDPAAEATVGRLWKVSIRVQATGTLRVNDVVSTGRYRYASADDRRRALWEQRGQPAVPAPPGGQLIGGAFTTNRTWVNGVLTASAVMARDLPELLDVSFDNTVVGFYSVKVAPEEIRFCRPTVNAFNWLALSAPGPLGSGFSFTACKEIANWGRQWEIQIMAILHADPSVTPANVHVELASYRTNPNAAQGMAIGADTLDTLVESQETNAWWDGALASLTVHASRRPTGPDARGYLAWDTIVLHYWVGNSYHVDSGEAQVASAVLTPTSVDNVDTFTRLPSCT